ncbi:MAG: ribosome maturation factor RimM [Methylococcales bacterium]|jgi:16S rRNA processing protein RimM|nr:ribosome maturation factor RimM [Methylococcales bacterium]MBT7408607.1 ribosome maturation factor RimM [Methylococcales bacterium]
MSAQSSYDLSSFEFEQSELPDDLIRMGKISGLFGVKGWLKIYSDTQPRKNILKYSPWYLHADKQWLKVDVEDGRVHNKGVVAKLLHCDDRTDAFAFLNYHIYSSRNLFDSLAKNEYYWSDLVGLDVYNLTEQYLGVVSHLIDASSQDVLVIKGEIERLIPFVKDHYIKSVDLEKKLIIVDWELDFDD